MDLDLDLDSIFNGFGSGFGFKCVLGLDWILDLKKFMDLDLDLDLFLDMDSNPNPRIQIRTSLLYSTRCTAENRPQMLKKITLIKVKDCQLLEGLLQDRPKLKYAIIF